MNKRSIRFLRAITALVALGLAAVLWLHGDANIVPPVKPAAQAAVTGPNWGVEDPLTRLLPIDSYDGPLGGTMHLTGARNEVTDKQLVLLAGPKPWNGVKLSFSDLTGPHKAVIPHTLLHWRQVGSVMTRQPYYQTRYVGLWPDPLLPAAAFDIAAQGRAFAWIDLHIPDDARAGQYNGTITISSQNTAPVKAKVSLHVWGFMLPHQNHVRTAFGVMGQGKFPLDTSALFDDMLAHRITPSHCMGDPKRTIVNGQEQWDWTDFDRNTNLRLSQGMTGFLAYIDKNNPPAELWQSHLAAKGWLPLAYSYIADEPTSAELPALNARLAAVKKAAPGLRNLMTARGFPNALNQVDIWCPNIIYFNPDQARQQQQTGHEVWWYPAFPTQHPDINLWTDYPALDDRIWAWMTWKYNLGGLLYWSVCSWQNTADPLKQAPAFYGAGAANGDGALVYPGPDGKPLDSIRWEAIRDGLQDYEVFCLLEAGANELDAAHKSPALASAARKLLAIDPSVMTSYTQYNSDPSALLSAREQMSRTVEQIVKALGHEPKIVARPRLHPEIPRLQAQAQASQAKPR